MAKEKGKKRQRQQNPQPFLANDGDSVASTRTRSKAPKHHQTQHELIPSGLSAKILKEALIQQKEIAEEDAAASDERNPNSAFFSVAEEDTSRREVEEDIDDFGGFSETQSQFGNYEEELNEEDERLLEAFLSKDAGPQRTLADIIAERIKVKALNVSSETQSLPKLDDNVINLYKGLGKFLSKYTAGKMPKAFKHIPSMQLWEDVLQLTEPENWSPNAMFQATRIFASNLGAKKAELFYKFVLLPRIRDDIRKNKRLHFALYQALKKSLYKPAAFNKGILFPLCKSGTCNLREAVIIGSILQKVSIPMLHSSVALFKLAEMEYCGTTSYFIKLLLEKKYALPYRVVDAVVAHFTRFLEDTRLMPVIWHQSLLAFVQRYKNELQKEDKDNLRLLIEKQKHKLVTPEILRELDNSRNRGEKNDPMLITSPISVVNKTIEEDRFDIPDVPMEED
ncbi:bystin [Tripterygium wilfordii]|uniref:Bystin n=1 Tax=Tripterygium wilfordii TaxID=458696 RepID=A0A7J7C299_TRIWF|nr:bystin isoform X2 [Tripterygium wilfordii]XP_038688517.1 bystin isoform X2 [Tripterygium wilfordii]KAF5728221.1 bystin [Tripterygium wilfordii]